MKARIFILTFGMPLFGAGVLYYAMTNRGYGSFGIYFLVVLLVISLGKLLLSEGKYVVDIKCSEFNLEIKYATPILISKTVVLPVSSIASIEFAARNWLVGYPPSVHIQHNDEWIRFEFLDKKIIEKDPG